MVCLQVESRVETINFGERKTLDALKEMVPNGPDCSIEAVGFHYASTILHKVPPKHTPGQAANQIFGTGYE
jgi:hypothetical protein